MKKFSKTIDFIWELIGQSLQGIKMYFVHSVKFLIINKL